jgi:hypothetical protein
MVAHLIIGVVCFGLALFPFLDPHYQGWPLWLHRLLCRLHGIHPVNWRDK